MKHDYAPFSLRSFLRFIGVAYFSLVFSLFTPCPLPASSLDLQIPLQNSSGATVQSITTCDERTNALGEKYLECNGISIYIKLIFEWLVRIAAILAVMMIVWGGVIWLTAAGNTGKVGEAQKIIGNSLTGLVLMLGSVTLLSIINPNLTNLSVLNLSLIKEKPLPTLIADSTFGGSLGARIGVIPCNPVLTPVANGSISVTPASSVGSPTAATDPCSPSTFSTHKTAGRIQYTPVPGGCGQELANAGVWDNAINQTPGNMPAGSMNAAKSSSYSLIDPRIIGALNAIAEQCGKANITALNEACGHSSREVATSGHWGGKAVDIGNLCNAPAVACTPDQRAIVTNLQAIGYTVCTQDKVCGASCDDDPTTHGANSHFHIQVN